MKNKYKKEFDIMLKNWAGVPIKFGDVDIVYGVCDRDEVNWFTLNGNYEYGNPENDAFFINGLGSDGHIYDLTWFWSKDLEKGNGLEDINWSEPDEIHQLNSLSESEAATIIANMMEQTNESIKLRNMSI